jgi:hypothetical protein
VDELVDERSLATRLLEKTPVVLSAPTRGKREDVGEVPEVEVPSSGDADDEDDAPTLVLPASDPKVPRG